MNYFRTMWYISALMVSIGITSASFAAEQSAQQSPRAEVSERIAKQMQAAGRGPYDKLKDAGRKPIEVIQFFAVDSGMTVLDMVTGSGYSAEILSAAVGPSGTVFAQNPFAILRLIGGEHHRGMMERIADNRLPNVKYLVVEPQDMPFDLEMDIVFWGQNIHDEYHDGGESAALNVLQHIMRALKPGGLLALSDHVGDAGNDNSDLHRIKPEIVMSLLVKAGYEIESTSDILANPDDDHKQSIFSDGLRYHTDQILVRARKPK